MNLNVLPIVVAYLVMIGVLAYVIYSDFFLYRIRNWSVLAIIAAWAVVAASHRFDHLPQDLLVAGVLFSLAVGFWFLGMLGAGDAKLLGACGLVVGFDDAFTLTALLLAFSIAFIAFLRVAANAFFLPLALGTRLVEIVESKKIPYGVPMALAAICIVVTRLAAIIRA